jgi:hypothetical protein
MLHWRCLLVNGSARERLTALCLDYFAARDPASRGDWLRHVGLFGGSPFFLSRPLLAKRDGAAAAEQAAAVAVTIAQVDAEHPRGYGSAVHRNDGEGNRQDGIVGA